MKLCKGLQSITNLTKEILFIYCFNFCFFLHWPASVKLLIIFYYSLMLIKKLLLLNNYFILSINILGLNLLHYVCIKLIEVP